jgi:quercetin dioxygenase-like cupin family protein
MTWNVVGPDDLEWTTREPEPPATAARHVARLSDLAGFTHTRANVWRYDPGATGRRHAHPDQEETFVVVSGTLTAYLGDPAEQRVVPAGGVVNVAAGTPLQLANEGGEELVLYAYGSPPSTESAVFLDPVA